MGIFDSLYNVFRNLFAVHEDDAWFQRKNVSQLDLEVCNGEARDDLSTRTCWKCVALNRTIFQKRKMPNFFHKNCKCLHDFLRNVEITTIFPMKKITMYLFKDKNKKAMMRSMGYIPDDAEVIYKYIDSYIKEKFISGNFDLQVLNRNGQHITMRILLDGARDHMNEKFGCHIGCVVWPNGQIRVATPLVKD